MKTVLVGEKETKEYVEEAKKLFEHEKDIEIKGIGRDTVIAVDVAELLKIEGFKVKHIKIDTEEKEEKRTSWISITIEK